MLQTNRKPPNDPEHPKAFWNNTAQHLGGAIFVLKPDLPIITPDGIPYGKSIWYPDSVMAPLLAPFQAHLVPT